jgi:hypothetical protein
VTDDSVVRFPEPALDLVDVYLALIDSDPDLALEDPRLVAVMDAMSREDIDRAQALLRDESETKLRRARALMLWRRRRVLQRDPRVLREIMPPRRTLSRLRLLEGFLELDGDRVAKLLPLRLSLRDRLVEALDDAEEALDAITQFGEAMESAEAGRG